MGHGALLCVLEVLAIGSCCYGLTSLWMWNELPLFAKIYGSCWFFLGIASNLCGLIALYKMNYGEEDEVTKESQFYVQYHYLLAWLTIVLGYPTYITQIWLGHYRNNYDHFILILALIPLIAWMYRQTHAIVLTTQIVTGLSIALHLWISILAKRYWGIGGSVAMLFNVVALSIPTKYNIWGLSSREFYVAGLAWTSIIFSMEENAMAKKPVVITELFKIK